jgi:hypothetical protein
MAIFLRYMLHYFSVDNSITISLYMYIWVEWSENTTTDLFKTFRIEKYIFINEIFKFVRHK